jgi:hypothetical protein
MYIPKTLQNLLLASVMFCLVMSGKSMNKKTITYVAKELHCEEVRRAWWISY